jgi:hypothetical protein
VPLQRRVAAGEEEDEAALLVHAGEGVDWPVAACNAGEAAAVGGVAVDVPETGALGGPEEGAVLQGRDPVALHVDPVRRALRQQRARRAGGGVDREEVERLLVATEALDVEGAPVHRPAHAGEVDVGARA